jgi:hypothetical protein
MKPDEKDKIRSALLHVGVDVDDIDDEDLEKLWAAKFRSVTRLRTAQGEWLKEAGLAPGVVSAILAATGMPLLNREVRTEEACTSKK